MNDAIDNDALTLFHVGPITDGWTDGHDLFGIVCEYVCHIILVYVWLPTNFSDSMLDSIEFGSFRSSISLFHHSFEF